MVYRYVSSKAIIARIANNFNIKHTDYIARAPEWIAEALGMIGVFTTLELKHLDVQVNNHRAKLPCDIKRLRGISHCGLRLRRSDAINVTDDDTVDGQYHPTETYSFIAGSNQIHTTFQSGCVTYHYKALPVDCDGFPMVPESEELMEALSFFILNRMIMRGYRHPIFNYEASFRQWEYYMQQAQIDCASPDIDMREQLSQLWTSFTVNKNAYEDTFFNQHSCLSDTEQYSCTSTEQVYALTFVLNVPGATIALTPDLPEVMSNTTKTFLRSNGTYNYNVSKEGYVTETGTLQIQGGSKTKTITLIIE